MRVLSVSSVYPNSSEPGLGLFVQARLKQIAQFADLKVIAPVPLINYARRGKGMFVGRLDPVSRSSTDVDVFHPRWLYPPYGTPVNVLCQFARLLPMVADIHRRFPFDLIDAHFCYPEGVTAALLSDVFRVPFTITLRGSETMFAEYATRRRLMQFALKRADAVITVSDNLRDFAIAQGASPNRVRTIPNGVDSDIFFPRNRAEIRNKLGIAAGRQLIVSVGELIEAKGHHLVIQGVKHLIANGFDAELVIAGKTARGGICYEAHLRKLVADLGLETRVRFTGWIDPNGLADLFSAADLFCLASYTEGWPNVVHEALSCGVPVVVSEVGGVPALVPDMQYGIIIPTKDVEALRQAMDQALRRPWDREAISAWGRSRDWAQVASEVIAVFESILRRPGAELAMGRMNNVRN